MRTRHKKPTVLYLCWKICPVIEISGASTAGSDRQTSNPPTHTKKKTHYVHRTVTPSLSISMCVCLFLSVPSPSSSSPPPLHHTGSLLFLKTSTGAWKGTRLLGGRYMAGVCRGCFCRSPCLSGCWRLHCSPSWGSRAHVTLARPWAHTCCLLGRLWRMDPSPPPAPRTWET